jgi:class 3 adenylate cyclase/tetratricopeptide (TPR) repeat protein
MTTCAVCGYEAGEPFKFCPECGAAAVPVGQEQRKVVTVLFCDVVGSTSLGESIDPEALRALLARYFERMKEAVERHGGTVEKFIGDAVVAVFGIPVTHEDDALRACRAAVEMRETFAEVGVEGRIGITTGEVVTGTEERLATGDAVNVAARLQQAAEPGEILLGGPTLELVRDAVEADVLEPLDLKGKAQPVETFRLIAAHEPGDRPSDRRFVGRERELSLLGEAWERALADERCELFTVIGEPGVGKSRLVAEAVAATDARCVSARCLPYGEGITYWPVIEMIKQLDALPSDQAAAEAIRSLLGESEAGASAEEIAWAFRKLLEEQAPLVVLFDDIQWGEETFLDLLEHVALLSSGAAILLVCTARAELVDRRPAWPVALRLDPLQKVDVDDLIGDEVPDELRERIAQAAGGNPLFVGEMLAMAEEGDGEVVVPPTLRALLAARLDQLAPPERQTLERGAVEGELFHRGAVQALAPGESQVTPRLATLVRKELIRPDRPVFPGEDGFRFRHLLIRDTAYDGLPKSARAELHERFAAWLEKRGPELIELDEIVGYHLEQAARYRQELGNPDPALAERAGERLAAAGTRALWRGDDRAAVALLERSLALTRPLRLDVHTELDLATAHRFDKPERWGRITEGAATRAHEAGDEAGEALARVFAGLQYSMVGANPDGVEVLARRALPLLEQANDHAGLSKVWFALASGVANMRGQYEDMAQAAEQALRHARLAGQQPRHLFDLEVALYWGPRPADDALRTLDASLPANPPPRSALIRSLFLGMLGRFDEAWPAARDASARWREVSGVDGSHLLADLARYEGDDEAAEAYLARFCDWAEAHGQRSYLSTYAPTRGRILWALGRYDEAEALAQLGREVGDEQDAATQGIWREAAALVRASRGEHEEAERLAREAVAISARTDAPLWHGDALYDLAEVLQLAGRTDEAAAAFEQALEQYELKRNLPLVEQTRARLGELRGVGGTVPERGLPQ